MGAFKTAQKMTALRRRDQRLEEDAMQRKYKKCPTCGLKIKSSAHQCSRRATRDKNGNVVYQSLR